MNVSIPWLFKALSLKGRVSRRHYWYFFLIYHVISISLCFLIDYLSPILRLCEKNGVFLLLIFIAYAFFCSYLSCAMAVKRLHDTNKKGWWIFLYFIPLLGWMILLYFLARKGDVRQNRYGRPTD